eukprot:scaffold18884_cov21-Tisochrysis_lutea.AAC.1
MTKESAVQSRMQQQGKALTQLPRFGHILLYIFEHNAPSGVNIEGYSCHECAQSCYLAEVQCTGAAFSLLAAEDEENGESAGEEEPAAPPPKPAGKKGKAKKHTQFTVVGMHDVGIACGARKDLHDWVPVLYLITHTHTFAPIHTQPDTASLFAALAEAGDEDGAAEAEEEEQQEEEVSPAKKKGEKKGKK